MWVLLALTTSLVTSINTVIFKNMVKTRHYLVVALGQSLTGLPFLVVAVLLWYRPLELAPLFWLGLIGTSVLNIVAVILAFKTLTLEDVSFLAPFAAFNPLLTTLISAVTLHELPSWMGILGIVLIGIGASLLGRTRQERLHVSLVKLFQRRSVQYVLGANLIWAITPTFEKVALLHSRPQNPALLALLSGSIISLGLMPFAVRSGLQATRSLTKMTPQLAVVGFLGTIGIIAGYTAFTLTNLGYATAIFKTNIFFTILLAGVFLKEKIEQRVVAAAFMFAGVILLTL